MFFCLVKDSYLHLLASDLASGIRITCKVVFNTKFFFYEMTDRLFFSSLFFLTLIFFSAGRSDRVQMRNDLAKINKVITEHTNHLAPYQFLTAFSQLISRICHSHDEVFVVLMEIIAKVFLAYPQQAMWMMTAVSKVI